MTRFRPGRRALLARTLAAAGPALLGFRCGGGSAVSVGCKQYSEQFILGEIQARLLEAAGFGVERRFNITTFLLHQAIATGGLDCYIEYTGTAYGAIMKEPWVRGAAREVIYDRVRGLYRERFGLVVGPPLGFENTYVLALGRARAEELGLRTISDLALAAPGLRIAAGHEYLERADGHRGLLETYAFGTPPETLPMDLNLVWEAVASGAADLLVGNSTDGRIPALDMLVLEDDRRYFPPYDAAVVYRPESGPGPPALAEALSGAIGPDTMRDLNRRVDVDGERFEKVAADFIEARNLRLEPAPRADAAPR